MTAQAGIDYLNQECRLCHAEVGAPCRSTMTGIQRDVHLSRVAQQPLPRPSYARTNSERLTYAEGYLQGATDALYRFSMPTARTKAWLQGPELAIMEMIQLIENEKRPTCCGGRIVDEEGCCMTCGRDFVCHLCDVEVGDQFHLCPSIGDIDAWIPVSIDLHHTKTVQHMTVDLTLTIDWDHQRVEIVHAGKVLVEFFTTDYYASMFPIEEFYPYVRQRIEEAMA